MFSYAENLNLMKFKYRFVALRYTTYSYFLHFIIFIFIFMLLIQVLIHTSKNLKELFLIREYHLVS